MTTGHFRDFGWSHTEAFQGPLISPNQVDVFIKVVALFDALLVYQFERTSTTQWRAVAVQI